jgi:type I restriction enzyme M protein
MPRQASSNTASTAQFGFKQKLWLAADKLRNNMDAAEPGRSGDGQPQAARRASGARQYKHVVLGLIFTKYNSDSFEKHYTKLVVREGYYAGADPEDPDEYRTENVFWAKRFNELSWPLMAKIQANSTESRTLATLRDALLPKLLSGAVPVIKLNATAP